MTTDQYKTLLCIPELDQTIAKATKRGKRVKPITAVFIAGVGVGLTLVISFCMLQLFAPQFLNLYLWSQHSMEIIIPVVLILAILATAKFIFQED